MLSIPRQTLRQKIHHSGARACTRAMEHPEADPSIPMVVSLRPICRYDLIRWTDGR